MNKFINKSTNKTALHSVVTGLVILSLISIKKWKNVVLSNDSAVLQLR